MKARYFILTALIAVGSSVLTFCALQWTQHKESNSLSANTANGQLVSMPFVSNGAYASGVDFRSAAAVSTPAVVHIKSVYHIQKSRTQSWFGFFEYGGAQPDPQSSGSGVIISSDGYVVTNNHVIEGADEIKVTLADHREMTARLIGSDKDTDIALLKIESDEELPSMAFANSDSVQVGQWVLAVGNPFNLNSTVTAGIVSAKARNINVLNNGYGQRNNTAIESFIQTDAAVNPGNSGGALVDVSGKLIGINSAIATPTGTFAGYSFAVPSNLVFKVINDLKDFGSVQRGFLGVNIRDVDQQIKDDLGLAAAEGVYIDRIIPGGSAESAGLQDEDVIIGINGVQVNSTPELQEQIARYRPGDKIEVSYIREGKSYTGKILLKNKYNNTENIDDKAFAEKLLGAKLASISELDKQTVGIDRGVKVSGLVEGKLKEYTEIRDGFIILNVNNEPVSSPEDIAEILRNRSGNVSIEGTYPGKAFTYLYAFKI